MHYLLSTFGSSGDVFPLVGLALELRRRGRRATLAINAHYEPLVRRYDLPFEPLGTQAEYDACLNNPDLWHPRRSFRHVFESLRPALREQYAQLARHAAEGPTIGVTSCFGFGALLAQEKLGVPVVSLHLQPAVVWSDLAPPTLPGVAGPRWLKRLAYRIGERCFIDPVVCPPLNTWRRELGLPPVDRIARRWHSPHGVLCLFPDWFAPPQTDWPRPLRQVDFPLWNRDSDRPPPDELLRFLDAGDPPIVFTPGSANSFGRSFFQAAVGACAALGRRAILLTGFRDQVPARLPDWCAWFPYVPLDRLLPRAAAFVHHGGIGSTSQAMLAGTPQLLMPLAHDQFDNAARLRRLGLADAVPAPRFTASRAARALDRLLADPQVADACRSISKRLESRAGLSQAADALEAFAAAPTSAARRE